MAETETEFTFTYAHFVADIDGLKTWQVVATLKRPTLERINAKLAELSREYDNVSVWRTNDNKAAAEARLARPLFKAMRRRDEIAA